jgi:short-subunit dehydrogenase
VQAGASTGTASDAAEEVATYETRMQTIERKLSRLEALQSATFMAAAAILVRVCWP